MILFIWIPINCALELSQSIEILPAKYLKCNFRTPTSRKRRGLFRKPVTGKYLKQREGKILGKINDVIWL